MVNRPFLLPLWLLTIAAAAEMFVGSATAYTGRLDVVTCAEAYDVDYAATSDYSGPLFQLALVATPTKTYDVGQTSSHTADTAGALAFCGGSGTMTPQTLMGHTVSVSSTCAITKIYGQVHLHANDLVYNQGNQESECPTGSTACAAPYAVERLTQLPLLWVPNNDAIPHKLHNTT